MPQQAGPACPQRSLTKPATPRQASWVMSSTVSSMLTSWDR